MSDRVLKYAKVAAQETVKFIFDAFIFGLRCVRYLIVIGGLSWLLDLHVPFKVSWGAAIIITWIIDELKDIVRNACERSAEQ